MPNFSNETINVLIEKFGFQEFFFLNTCNRILFIYIANNQLSKNELRTFFETLNPFIENVSDLVDKCNLYKGEKVVDHLFRVASGLNSMVVGEHEILGQVKKAYNHCREQKYIGDNLRLLFEYAIPYAKRIYHQTGIGRHTVSVVALAMSQIKNIEHKSTKKVLILGAGESIQKAVKFLVKFGYQNISIYNRTLSKAEELCKSCGNGKANSLDNIEQHKEGFDILISCLDFKANFVNKELYTKLLNKDESPKVVIDLAVPNNVSIDLKQHFNLRYIDVESLREQANANIEKRKLSLSDAEAMIEEQKTEFALILKKRKLERAFSEIPLKMKEVKAHAIETVFEKELTQTDEATRALIEKMLTYVEKKYISIPMKMTKDAVFGKLKK